MHGNETPGSRDLGDVHAGNERKKDHGRVAGAKSSILRLIAIDSRAAPVRSPA